MTVATNGAVSITKDPIFGYSVMTEDGWIPISFLSPADKQIVWKAVDWSSTILAVFPDLPELFV